MQSAAIPADSTKKRSAAPIDSAAAPAEASAAFLSLLPPPDVTRSNAALRAFVQQVSGFARQRQQAQLLAVADDKIVISYGGGIFGKQAFKAFLNDQETNAYSRIRMALELGGALDNADEETGDTSAWFCFPYCQSARLWMKKLPDADVDPFSTYIGLTARVQLHKKPDKQSPVVATLAYPVLVLAESAEQDAGRAGWMALKTTDGKARGYVEAAAVYGSAAMKLLIAQKQGRYRIMSVASFD